MTTRKPAAVSMDPSLFEKAKARGRRLGFPTFSAYVSQLIRSDIAAGGGIAVHEESAPPPVIEPRQETHYQKPKRPRKPKGT